MQTKAHLDNAWVAVHTRVLHEKSTAEHLLLNGYECFLPLQYKKPYKTAQLQKDEKQMPSVPLFPGYLFCRYKLRHNFPILRTPGVIRILGYDGAPAVIPDGEVWSISKIVTSGLSTEPYQFLKSGQKVRINSGPLNGVEGYLISIVNKNTCKIAVGVSVVERSVVVNVINTDVCAINRIRSRGMRDKRKIW